MYNKLLISAGGGIVSPNQQGEQVKAATIAIGLGGTGISCLKTLKKEVYDRLKPDDVSAVVPTYKHIKFLAIDSDAGSLGEGGKIDSIDPITEFLDISNDDINGLLAKAAALKIDPALKWLKAAATEPDRHGVTIHSAEAGAGGVRQIGRLLLFQKLNQFVEKFGNMLKSAIEGLGVTDSDSKTELNIHIFTGMGGGTGAGTFLDVCYLVQHVLTRNNLAGKAQVCGYFFLPDVNLARVQQENVKNFIKANGFASMVDLDYCMNFNTNGGEWNQFYAGDVTVKTKEPPVKLAHLICARNTNGALHENAYDYAMHVVTDYVMNFLIKSESGKDDFSMKGHISNIFKIMNEEKKKAQHGACYNYCILGASNAYLPYKDITTYLASKIFEQFNSVSNNIPTDADLTEFIKTAHLSYRDISASLKKSVPQVTLPDYNVKDAYEDLCSTQPGYIPRTFGVAGDTEYGLERDQAAIRSALGTNKKALTEVVEDVFEQSDRNATASLIHKLKMGLLDLAKKPEKGPFFASYLLYSVTARSFINHIDGMIVDNKSHWDQAIANLSARDREARELLLAVQNSNVLNRKSKVRECINTYHSKYQEGMNIEFYETMDVVLRDFKMKAENLSEQYFKKFADIFEKLQQTFDANLTTLSQPQTRDVQYSIKLISIQDLQESLDNAVREMRINDLISKFIDYMLKNQDVWYSQKEDNIVHAVSSFFLNTLSDHTNKTMIDYLQVKYSTTDPGVLAARIYEEIILPVANKATPMFWANATIPASSRLGFCSLPRTSDEVNGAAQRYHTSSPTVALRPSYCDDRISILLFDCGIPMYRYNGTEPYRPQGDATIGEHLYEGAVGDARDWRYLYDITPYSCSEENNDRYDNLTKKAKVLDEAFEAGTIYQKDIGANDYEYVIKIVDEDAVNKQINDIAAASKLPVNEAEAVLARITGAEIPVIAEQTVEKMGLMEIRKEITKDIILESEYLYNAAIAAIDLLNKRTAAIRDLETQIKRRKVTLPIFINALCTGGIVGENDYTYSYQKTSFGLVNRIELTNVSSEPFGQKLPIYSAFLGFCNLDPAVLEEIEAESKRKLVEEPDAVSAAKELALSLFSQENISKKAEIAQRTYPESANEIIKFLQDMVFEVKNF